MTTEELRMAKKAVQKRDAEAAKIELARRDRNDFIEYVLGYRQAAIHREMQALWDREFDSYTEVPRGVGKTTQSAASVAFDIGHNLNIRVKYLQQNDDQAARTCAMIREILEKEEYKRVFPHVKPGTNWGKTSLTVQRPGTMRDPTLEACSIFGRAGGRWDLIIPDDVCDLRNSIQQPKLREQVKTAWANTWAPMADSTSGKRPRIRKVGTPWHVDDLTAAWRKYHGARGTLMRRPVVGFDSPWSEITSEYLADFKEQYGSIAYARAYELRPLSDEDTPIRAEWIKYTIPHEIEVPSLYRYLGADLAFKSKRENDFTVFCDVGRTMAGDLILLRVLRLKQPFAIVQEAVKKWIGNVRYYGIQIDAHGQQEELARQLVEWTGTSIVYDTRPEDKMTRASRLGVPIERGEFHMIGEAGIVSPEQKIVFDEITQFPVASHDDCMDALAYAVEIALKDRSFERMGSISVGNDDDDYVGRRSYGDYDPT